MKSPSHHSPMQSNAVRGVFMLVWALAAAACADGGGAGGEGPDGIDGAGADGSDSSTSDDSGIPDGEGTPGEDIAGDANDTSTEDADGFPELEPGFELVNLGVSGTVHHLFAASPTRVYAVGDGGVILRFNGKAWFPEDSGTSVALRGVWSLPDGPAYAVGDAGTLLVDTGAGFVPVAVPTSENLRAVHGASADAVYVVGDAGVILRGAGDSFVREESSWGLPLYAVWDTGTGQVFAASEQAQILRRIGGAWISTQAAGSGVTFRGLWGDGEGVFAVGSGGTLSRFVDNGWVVQVTNDFEGRDLYAVVGLPNGQVVAVGDQGTLIERDGEKWSLVEAVGPLNRQANLRAVTATLDEEGMARMVAAGAEGRALLADGDGAVWVDTSLAPTADLNDVWVSDEEAVSVGAAGVAFSRPTGGRWAGEPTGTDRDLYGIWQRASGEVWAVGDGVVVRRKAAVWSTVQTGRDDDLRVVAEQQGVLFAAGRKGVVLRESGELWTPEPAPLAQAWFDLWPAPDGRLFAAGQDGAFAVRSADGEWSQVAVPAFTSLRSVWGRLHQGKLEVLVAGDNGTLLVGDGASFEPVYSGPSEFLYGVWAADDGFAVAVGWAGRVLHREPGLEFTVVEPGSLRVLHSVMGEPAGGYVAVGRGGTILQYRPGP